ncbi:helix-turn-helix transcriptional regulator [Roseomonas sp. NAR14]|uniref:Helix-turn-helix transcriptional regulator n=1 Tax=Roseomonas acroporae TaxID=2937791 RepID=A0A9X1YB33_9PROT|nr:helix-turn-helix transcriptional regulator [Roseomonas acroporae]MCK8787474.1 helix-turn-helix transcriptional regulator [Roseomonas acroporae]
MPDSPPSPLAERVAGRLERLDLDPETASHRAGLPPDAIGKVLNGQGQPPRGERLRKLAEVLECSIAWLVGLDPDEPPPPEVLEEDQASFRLLAGDQEALLRAYARLDVASRAALLRVALKMAGPEPEPEPARPAAPPPATAKPRRRRAAPAPALDLDRPEG